MISKLFLILILIVSALILMPFTVTYGKSVTSSTTPNFTLSDLTGKNISLSDYLGEKVILLVFSATWCPPCRKEVPELKEIYEKFKKEDFVLLQIFIGESKKKVTSFAKKNNIAYSVLVDEKNKAASSYSVRGIPCVFLINKKGEIAFTFTGLTRSDFLSDKIEKLLR